MHDRDRDRDVEEHAAADHAVPQTRGIEEPVGQRGGDRIRLPLDPREGEPRIPREHHRVPLHELEQRRERRLPSRRRTGEAAARRIPDGRAGRPRRAQEDERRRRKRRCAIRERDALDEVELGVFGERREGKGRMSELRRMEEREAPRRHGPAAERAGRGPEQPRRREVHHEVALDRFAQRGSARPRVAPAAPLP